MPSTACSCTRQAMLQCIDYPFSAVPSADRYEGVVVSGISSQCGCAKPASRSPHVNAAAMWPERSALVKNITSCHTDHAGVAGQDILTGVDCSRHNGIAHLLEL